MKLLCERKKKQFWLLYVQFCVSAYLFIFAYFFLPFFFFLILAVKGT